jgi:hypothetical protein
MGLLEHNLRVAQVKMKQHADKHRFKREFEFRLGFPKALTL